MTEKDSKIGIAFAGSQTVEASFVFPIIILIVIALIWLCIFLYDRVAVYADCANFLEYACSEQGRNLPENDLQVEVYRYIAEYPYVQGIQVTTVKTGTNISIVADVELHIPGRGLIGMFTKHIRDIHVEQTRKVHYREERQRIANLFL